jgi:hypothetical protein
VIRKPGRIELRDETLQVQHHPQVCPQCANYCLHDGNGNGYVHGNGVAIGSCLGVGGLDSVAVVRGETAQAIGAALDGEAARFEDIGWSVAAKVWSETADFVRQWAARAMH